MEPEELRRLVFEAAKKGRANRTHIEQEKEEANRLKRERDENEARLILAQLSERVEEATRLGLELCALASLTRLDFKGDKLGGVESLIGAKAIVRDICRKAGFIVFVGPFSRHEYASEEWTLGLHIPEAQG